MMRTPAYNLAVNDIISLDGEVWETVTEVSHRVPWYRDLLIRTNVTTHTLYPHAHVLLKY